MVFFISVTVLVTSIPVVTVAEETVYGRQETSAQNETNVEVQVVSEIQEKREPNIKYFQMSDGTITAAVYPKRNLD